MPKDTASFTTRDLPWAKLGVVIDEPLSAEKAIVKAGLDFDVELRPVRYQDSTKKKSLAFTGRSVIVRTDTDEPFGIASDDYTIIQYREAFEFIDQINPEIVAAGGLKGNKHAFIVVKGPSFDVLGGDLHDLFIVLRTSHDCSKAVEVFLMPLRHKCMNALSLWSFGKDARQKWSVRHVTTAKEKLAAAQNVLQQMDGYKAEFDAVAQKLAAIDLEIEDAQEVLRTVLPNRPRRDDIIENVTGLFQSSTTLEGFHGTGWGLVNAVGEYFEHLRKGGTKESRLTNDLAGATNKYVNRTAQLLRRR